MPGKEPTRKAVIDKNEEPSVDEDEEGSTPERCSVIEWQAGSRKVKEKELQNRHKQRQSSEALKQFATGHGNFLLTVRAGTGYVEEFRVPYPPTAPKLLLGIENIPEMHLTLTCRKKCQVEVKGSFEQAELRFGSIRIYIIRGTDEKHSKPMILIRVSEGNRINDRINLVMLMQKSLKLQLMPIFYIGGC